MTRLDRLESAVTHISDVDRRIGADAAAMLRLHGGRLQAQPHR